MYVITRSGWLAMPESASLTPFSMDTPIAGSNNTKTSICNNTVGSSLLTDGSTLCDVLLTVMTKACDLIPMASSTSERTFEPPCEIPCKNLC